MRGRKGNRRGAAVLETSLVLFSFLVLTMGMLDLGLAVFRYHVLANAARHAARRAIVHGDRASVLGTWGPATIDVPASAAGVPVIDPGQGGVQPLLVGCDLSETRVQVEWLGGGNSYEDPVRVTVRSPYDHFFTTIFPQTRITLTASSTMQIAH